MTIVMAFIALMIPVMSGLTQWYSTKLMSSAQPQAGDEENRRKPLSLPLFVCLLHIRPDQLINIYLVQIGSLAAKANMVQKYNERHKK